MRQYFVLFPELKLLSLAFEEAFSATTNSKLGYNQAYCQAFQETCLSYLIDAASLLFFVMDSSQVDNTNTPKTHLLIHAC